MTDRFDRLLDPVLVVGAGVAGLVVARDLAVAGVPVTVLELNDRIGGQLAAVELAGVEVDAGAESFATRDAAVAGLLADLGLAADIVPPLDSPAWLVHGPRDAVPLPAASLLGIPTIPFAADVTAAIGWAGSLRAQLDSFLPLLRPERYRTVAELVRGRMGRRVLDRLVAPVARGVYSTAPETLLVDAVAPGLRGALQRHGSLRMAVAEQRAASPAGSQVEGLRGGIHRLAAVLAAAATTAGAEIRTGVRVTAVDADGVTTATGERLTGRVVVAAPGVASAATRQREITVVLAAVDAPGLDVRPRGTGALVADPAIGARAFTHSSAKWAWLGEPLPAHRHLVRLSYDAPPADPAAAVLADLPAMAGVPIDRVVDVVARTWTRTLAAAPVPAGVLAVGEAASATGLARIVAGAREVATRLSGADLIGPEGPGGGAKA